MVIESLPLNYWTFLPSHMELYLCVMLTFTKIAKRKTPL